MAIMYNVNRPHRSSGTVGTISFEEFRKQAEQELAKQKLAVRLEEVKPKPEPRLFKFFKKLFAKKKKVVTVSKVEELQVTITEKKVPVEPAFDNFVKHQKPEKFETITPRTIKRENIVAMPNAIIVKMQDYFHDPEFKLIGESRVDGQPIYHYVGQDFARTVTMKSHLMPKYEELI